MTAIIIAHFKAQEGKLAEMAEVFKASLGATRGFDGCLGSMCTLRRQPICTR